MKSKQHTSQIEQSLVGCALVCANFNPRGFFFGEKKMIERLKKEDPNWDLIDSQAVFIKDEKKSGV